MQIDFYDYTADNRIINKSLPETPLQTVVSATPFRPLSDLTGTLLLAYNATAYAANYCSFGGKYYYITDRELLTGQKMQLTCRVDVLKTYASAILDLPVWCKRSATLQNKYMLDTKAPVLQKKKVSGQPGNTIGAHSTDMILITVG